LLRKEKRKEFENNNKLILTENHFIGLPLKFQYLRYPGQIESETTTAKK